MIVELLLTVVGVLLTSVAFLIPDVVMPFTDELHDLAVFVGSNLGGLNSFLPVTEVAAVLGWCMTVYLPFVVGFVVVRWVWSHIPGIGGG